MNGEQRFDVLSLVVAILIAMFVNGIVVQGVVSENGQAYIEWSAEWCEDRGGQLINEQAFISGGLHCQLENGSSVRMADVWDGTESSSGV